MDFWCGGFDCKMCFCGHKAQKQSCPNLEIFGEEILATRIFKHQEMENRTNMVKVRMTNKEKIKLSEMAASSGRNVSEYIRAKLFGGEKATINAVEFLKTYQMQIYEMQKIGNNINQLAHYANICIKSGMLSEAVVQEMDQRIGELTKIEIKLEDAMRRIGRARY